MARLQRKKRPGTKKARGSAEDQAGIASASSSSSESRTLQRSETIKESRKRPVPLAKSAVVKEKRGYLQQALQFLREVKIELKKVTWPTRKQTLGSTAVVIVLVILISLFLGLVDMGLSGLFRSILQ